jgi:hypothetical protein
MREITTGAIYNSGAAFTTCCSSYFGFLNWKIHMLVLWHVEGNVT